METKLCKACGIEKKLEEFLVRKRSEKGRHPRCKICVKTNNFIEGCESEKGSYKDVIGTKHITNEGLTVTIISGTNLKNLTAQFDDGSIVENIIFGNLKRGSLNHPNTKKVKGFNKDKVKKEENKEKRLNLIENRKSTNYINNQGCEFKIVDYKSHNNIDIEFKDGTKNYNVRFEKIKSGSINNKNFKDVAGVGFMGDKIFNFYYDSKHFSYKRWHNMIYRCYSEKTQSKQPTYVGCLVVDEWHNFQNFAQWCEDNWKPWMDKTWHIDKDILCPDCKVYSPETCCFVPSDINILFTKRQNYRGDLPIGTHKSSKNRWRATVSKNGNTFNLSVFTTPEEAFEAYKTAKEEYIKEIADKWKDLIDPRVYEAMYNYKININI